MEYFSQAVRHKIKCCRVCSILAFQEVGLTLSVDPSGNYVEKACTIMKLHQGVRKSKEHFACEPMEQHLFCYTEDFVCLPEW